MITSNHEYYVSLEVAKLLKRAGFDRETFSHWIESDVNNPDFKFSGLSDKPILYDGYTPINEDAWVVRKKDCNNYNNECPLIYNYSAPTLDVAQIWLREVKKYHIYVRPYSLDDRTYVTNIVITDSMWGPVQDDNKKVIIFKTYEEAQEAGIKKVLELILKK